MRRAVCWTFTAWLFSASAWAQSANVCDLTHDGTVDIADFNVAVNLALGRSPCTANVLGNGICDVALVQRVLNAMLGASCVSGATGNGHTVSLSWVASTSPMVIGYNLYRATSENGPYVKLNLTLIGETSYTDITVKSGQTYYYVATAVDAGKNESAYSDGARAVVPSP